MEWTRTLEARVDEKTRELDQAYYHLMQSEKMASLGKLAAVVAHEINNPLAGIRTYARLLRRRLQAESAAPDAETDRALQTIDIEAGRCGEIVRNLLVFSRKSPSLLLAEDVAPLLERCRVLLRHQAEMLSVTLTVTAPPEPLRVECDASQVEQMLLALGINALEATPSGGAVSIAARAEGEAAVFQVSDTGCGIAPDDQARIFEPFFTTKERGHGVGLGLAVVYGIVTRHQGTLDVVSQPGAGTTFTVRLPLRQPPGGGAEPGAQAERQP
jgi:two-component system NtrC family sensor kinase